MHREDGEYGKTRNINHNVILICILGGYLAINAVLLYLHEPWRDEAQAWLIARDVPLLQIPAHMRYEGHPCLWHLILAPFAKLGMPYLTINFISLIVMVIAATLLLFRSRMPTIVKAIVLFSVVCTYFYPVIARSYCLIPPLLFGSAYCFKERWEHPFRYTLMIALLIQTHALMVITAFFMCLCLLVECILQYREKRERSILIIGAKALSLPLISVVLFGCQMIGASDSSAFPVYLTGIPELIGAITQGTERKFPALFGKSFILGVACVLLIVLLCFIYILRSWSAEKWTAFIVVSGTIVGHSLFYALVYGPSIQRKLLMPLVMVWGIWILEESQKEKIVKILQGVVCVILIVITFALFPEVGNDMLNSYSGGREAGTWAYNNVPKDAIIICDNQALCLAAVPYLHQRYYLDAATGKEASYAKWEKGWSDTTITYQDFVDWVDALDIGNHEVWLISCTAGSSIDGAKQLGENYDIQFLSSRKSATGEDFVIYRLR